LFLLESTAKLTKFLLACNSNVPFFLHSSRESSTLYVENRCCHLKSHFSISHCFYCRFHSFLFPVSLIKFNFTDQYLTN
jgi:hypothetical protein